MMKRSMAKVWKFCKFFFADLTRGILFILALPMIFALFLALVFSTSLLDPFLYNEKKDKDTSPPKHNLDVIYLDQGWQEGYRQKFYFTPQGSHIIPLAVALALEGADTDQLMFGENGLATTRFGYVPYPSTVGVDPANPEGPNPFGLPIGFSMDKNRSGETMLGMTCAACHTSNIKIGEDWVRVDGGISLADFMAFMKSMDDGIEQTINEPAKFKRFARRMGAETEAEMSAIKDGLKIVSADRQAWQRRNATTFDHGPARVDAFSIIFNQVVARDMGLDTKDQYGNVITPGAPVSYPVLWDTPFMGRVQWSGGSNNKKPGDSLGRNVGQTLGVFGHSEVATQSTLPGFCSSIRRKELELYNFWLKSLLSPRWEDTNLIGILPDIDYDAASRGRDIFYGVGREHGCVSCHGNQPDDWRERTFDEKQVCEAPMKLVELDTVKTDDAMVNVSMRKNAKTGILAGTPSKLKQGQTLRAEEDYMVVLGEVIAGSIVGSFLSVSCDGSVGMTTLIETASAFGKIQKSQHKFDKRVGGGFALEKDKLELECEGAKPYSYTTYKARALNGVWASAPYLHNGSVPSLYDMLLPPSDSAENCEPGTCRPDTFYVGSPVYDPDKVGFDYSGETGGKVFDTSIPGNRNSGHLFGTKLSEEERLDLIEYLKTL